MQFILSILFLWLLRVWSIGGWASLSAVQMAIFGVLVLVLEYTAEG